MPKYWVKNYFAHGRFPEVGQKQKTEEKEREKERKTEQWLQQWPSYAWRTQVAWAKKKKRRERKTE